MADYLYMQPGRLRRITLTEGVEVEVDDDVLSYGRSPYASDLERSNSSEKTIQATTKTARLRSWNRWTTKLIVPPGVPPDRRAAAASFSQPAEGSLKTPASSSQSLNGLNIRLALLERAT